MSYSLMPYVVDFSKLKAIIGSKDERILAAILKLAECEDEEEPIAAVDEPEDDEDADDDDDEDDEIGMKKAITDLIMGRRLVESAGYEYGYALEKICQYSGSDVPSDAWCGIRWEVLEATGADVLLLTSGSPVNLPTIDDFPTIGHLTAEQVSSALAQAQGGVTTLAPKGKKIQKTLVQRIFGPLVGMLLKRMMGINRGPITQEDLQDNYKEYLGWLREAAAKKAGIVFFYY